MIPIRIDASSLAEEFSLSADEVENMIEHAVKRVTLRFAENWSAQAGMHLNSTKQQFQRSILVVDEGRFKGAVVLSNQSSPVPNMVEQGASGFDMKKGFQNSPKAKKTEDGGWYLTIPFRFATPGAIGESEVFSAKLPEQVYQIVKDKPSSKTQMGERTGASEGVDRSELPEEFQKLKNRPSFTTVNQKETFEAYQHKTSIYEGVQRSAQTYENATQGQYVSFRRVSDNSDPMSWIHRGIRARNLAEKALSNTNIGAEVGFAVDDFLANRQRA